MDEESACLVSCRRISLNVSHKGLNKFSHQYGEYEELRLCIKQPYEILLERSKIERFSQYKYAFLCTFVGSDAFEVMDHSEWCKRQTDTEWVLYQQGSGYAGTFVVKHKELGTKIAVTIGVHNYAPWLTVLTDVETETADAITSSFYSDNAKRPYHHDHWGHTRMSKGQLDGVSVIATLEDVEDMEGKYRVKIELVA